MMTGNEIKELIKGAGVKCWEVAEALGMQDSSFSRRLRKPFSDEEAAQICAIVDRLAAKSNQPTKTNNNMEE